MRERSVMLAWLLSFAASSIAANARSAGRPPRPSAMSSRVTLDDSHFHLTNYVQRGITLRDMLRLMGDSVGRVAVFGIPLQQEWMYSVTGDRGPTYYLQSDAPLYYYSFTDAVIATEYLSLPPRDRARFDPMITGFNPGDMYAADHIRRVLATFPGVFTGIGEFTRAQGVRVGRRRCPDRRACSIRRSTACSRRRARSACSRSSTTTWTCRSPPTRRRRRTSTR